MIYFLYGHAWIQAIYEGHLPGFLNALIVGQDTNPVEVYWRAGDSMVWASGTLTLIFGGLMLGFYSKSAALLRNSWFLSLGLVFFVLLTSHFLPLLHENEYVYLLGPKRLVNPDFLAQDWMWRNTPPSHFLFELLVSPWTLFLDPLSLALVGRLLVWTLLVGALASLARTLGIGPWSFAVGFSFWIYANQSPAAGEWIFHGLEAKCVSYGLLFLALRNVLTGKFRAAGAFCGLSISFHHLVGGWGALGLLAAVAIGESQERLRKTIRFGVFTFLFAIPGLLAALVYLWKTRGMSGEDYAVAVFFRAPHHLDPASFLSGRVVLEMGVYFFLTAFALWTSFPRKVAASTLIFLTTLMGVFGAGVLARQTGQLSFLTLYPFRLGPIFLLLLFSFSIFPFLKRKILERGRFMRGVCLVASIFLVYHLFQHRMPVKAFKSTASFIYEWTHFLSQGEKDDFEKMARWIKDHTSPRSIFVAPPWEERFWLLAERAEVVGFKYIAPGPLMKEWMARLTELNGGAPVLDVGLVALKKNYPELTAERLLQISEKYDADYYLTMKERPDLPFPLIHANASYYLYGLNKREKVVSSA